MINLYTDFVHTVVVEGKAYKVFPFFNRVLEIYDIAEDEGMSEEDIVQTQFYILTKGKYTVDANTAAEVVRETLEQVNNVGRKSGGSKRTYDFNEDAFLIYAAFRQVYGIDLLEERDRLHYQAFLAMFSALPSDTRIAQVMQIRAKDIPKRTKHNSEEIQNLLRLKAQWALKPKSGDTLQDGLWKMYEALYKKAGE